MENIAKILQQKATKAHDTYLSVCRSAMHDAEPVNLSVTLSALPSKVEDDGSFVVLTGTRTKPYGIGAENRPELLFLYNKKGGLFIESSLIIRIIQENRKSLEACIDDTYSIMGVRLNLGILSNYVNESFLDSLTVLHEADY